MSKSRGREEKLRQKKAERGKKKKLGNIKSPTFLWGFFLANFNCKTGEIEIFDQKVPTSWDLPHICILFLLSLFCRTGSATIGSTGSQPRSAHFLRFAAQSCRGFCTLGDACCHPIELHSSPCRKDPTVLKKTTRSEFTIAL